MSQSKREALNKMKTLNPSIIINLKKDLSYAIKKNDYNLLSPEVICLSKELDKLMTPIFETQLNSYLNLNSNSNQ